jgi:lycopene beta-cyclase
MASVERCDLAIVGGGLAGGLIALTTRRTRPDARVLLIEGSDRLGGNHIWSFFDSDLAPAELTLLDPLVSRTWDGYDISFPGYRRTIATGYASIRSEQFDAMLRAALPPDALRLGVAVQAMTATEVNLADGSTIMAGGVIDARGAGDLSALELGWQKFVGIEYRFAAPHGIAHPTIMDARVEQIDGYRFVYLLPFAEDRLFIEDTYYSDTPDIDSAALTARIEAYAGVRGWRIVAVEREEIAALPVALGGEFERLWGEDGVAKVGVRAGLFHPTTGYSLPDAARTAALVATLDDWSGPALHAALRDHARRTWRARGFYRLLDRMLFRAAQGPERRQVLERFYGLDQHLIERFYAAQSTFADKARILLGKPPVPIMRAIRAAAA